MSRFGTTVTEICGGGGNSDQASTNAVNVVGNVTAAITGIAFAGAGYGLNVYFGGMKYGRVTGKITNTVGGPGVHTA